MARPARLATFNYLGIYAYALTFCAHRRLRRFDEPRVADVVLLKMMQTAKEHAFAVLAYCCMPDHLHLLVQGTCDGADLKACVKVFRQRTSVAYRRAFAHDLWLNGYYERVVRRDEELSAVAKYIAENPIRAGLVRAADEWAHTGGELLKRCRPN